MKIALTEHNYGDWSFQSLPWEGLQELIVCYVGPQLVISQKIAHHYVRWAENETQLGQRRYGFKP